MKSDKPSRKPDTGSAAKKTPAATPKKKIAKAAKTESANPKKQKIKLPKILLEGDNPPAPERSGPGQRYSSPGGGSSGQGIETGGELPEAYGTERLMITARDPQWIYAYWDLTNAQLKKYNSSAADGHLTLRVYKENFERDAHTEVQVHPESRNWFVHVGQGGTRYLGELGYHDRKRAWVSISKSAPTLTPPESLSPDTSVRFATIPIEMPFERLLQLVKEAARQHQPLAEAIREMRAAGNDALPGPKQVRSPRWTAEQDEALSRLVYVDDVRRIWIGSLEITELIRRQLMDQVSSLTLAEWTVPTSPTGAISSLSSPFGGMERRKSFWFNVNAELIIYGATEPDATVKIGGRKIALRPDGTFSYRFILPDGDYDLPAEATSADGDDSRLAELKFSRATKYRGDVGAHPQDPKMKAPRVENVH